MVESWTGLTKKLLDSSYKKKLPIAGSFELTPRCNFHCKMCYVCRGANDNEAMASELTADDWIRIGKDARDAGLFYLTLTGGEVFLRKDFRKIYEALAQMGLRIVIYSNGSLITQEIARWLKEAPPAMVSVTVYGASSETYERITGAASGFSNTLRGLDALKTQGIVTGIKMTAVKGNYKEFDQIYDIAKKYNTGLGIVSYISPRREGDSTDPEGNRLSPEEIITFEKMAISRNNDLGSQEHSTNLDEDNMTILPEDRSAELIDKDSAFTCYAGHAGFWITWDGKLTPCGLLCTPEERPLDIGFYNAWEALKEKCRIIPQCTECNNCSLRQYCGTCPARRITESGAFDKPADYLCDQAKYRRLQMNSNTNL